MRFNSPALALALMGPWLAISIVAFWHHGLPTSPELLYGAFWTAALGVFVAIMSTTYCLTALRGHIVLIGLIVHIMALLAPGLHTSIGALAALLLFLPLLALPKSFLLHIQQQICGHIPSKSPDWDAWATTNAPLIMAYADAHALDTSKPQMITLNIQPYGPFSGPIITQITATDDSNRRFADRLSPQTQQQKHAYYALTKALRAWVGPRTHTEVQANIVLNPATTSHEKLAQKAHTAPADRFFLYPLSTTMIGHGGLLFAWIMAFSLCLFLTDVIHDVAQSKRAQAQELALPTLVLTPKTPLDATAAAALHDQATEAWSHTTDTFATQIVCVRTRTGQVFSYLTRYTPNSPHPQVEKGKQTDAVFAQNPCADALTP